MNLRLKAIGKFDKVGEQVLAEQVLPLPGPGDPPATLPIRWTVKVAFFKVTLVGRLEATVEP